MALWSEHPTNTVFITVGYEQPKQLASCSRQLTISFLLLSSPMPSNEMDRYQILHGVYSVYLSIVLSTSDLLFCILFLLFGLCIHYFVQFSFDSALSSFLSTCLFILSTCPFWAAAPKGPMTYAFTHREISPPPSPSPPSPSTPFEAYILVLRLKS